MDWLTMDSYSLQKCKSGP